ncbi:MAG: hypothetical protein AAF693_10775 [Bacteroidota bacterium]
MKSITFIRPKESFNKNCSYQIAIGNKILTELKIGEEKSVEIPKGLEHASVQANIYWCGSEKMKLTQIGDDESVIVTGNEFLNRKLPLMGALFLMTGIVIFNDQGILIKGIGIGILSLFLIGLVGTLTVGRNQWIKLRKVKANSLYRRS